MRLIAYTRVSGRAQIDGYGLAIQDRENRSWARAHGHRIVAALSDEGVSGALDAVDRAALGAAIIMLRDRPRRADGLLIPRLDRLARALTVQEAALALIWREGGRVFATDSGEILQDDPDDPMRTAMRQMAGIFAELDRRTTVKKLRDGRQAKKASGRHASGAYAFGYRGEGTGRARDAAPEPTEQTAVARIVELRGAGQSYRQIASVLDTEGLRPRRAAAWSAMSVRRVALRHPDA